MFFRKKSVKDAAAFPKGWASLHKDEWWKMNVKMPPRGVPVLFCGEDHVWIGKVEFYQEGKAFITAYSEIEGWAWSWKSSSPLFWRYLPSIPSRSNPSD